MSGRDYERLQLTHQVEHDGLTGGVFTARLLERGDTAMRREGWATSVRELPDLGAPLFHAHAEIGESAVVEVDDVLVNISLYSGRVYIEAAAPSREAISALVERLHQLLPAPDPSSAHEVTVTFWTYGPHGPMPSWRSIAVPSWDEIRENYGARTRAGLEGLMHDWQPAHGGQLVLWHGAAGTGKTFGLRALAWQWREWCDFQYIVDPDTFFGQHADYLMSVLLQPEYMGAMVPSPHGFIAHDALSVSVAEITSNDGDDGGSGRGKPWRVLILEDTGELLTADARMVIGQGLSRFLNVVDGLIGQGLRVLVLVTTNEEIRKLHPAVARPGRCAANIEFEPLTKAEAKGWLEAHGHSADHIGSATLAELYARLEGRPPGESLEPVGFADLK
jgi:ATPase family associated with various cellular activities (AAA)